jgi:hypothetical protein
VPIALKSSHKRPHLHLKGEASYDYRICVHAINMDIRSYQT